MKRMVLLMMTFFLVATLATLAASCGPAGKVITVGSKEFTEQRLLGQMMKLVLENAGWTVDDKTGLGGTMIARLALLEGDIDVYMEYTGTALLVHLGHEEPITDPDLAYETVRDEDLEQNGIVWLQPSLFDNTYTVMMRRSDAEAWDIHSISNLAAYVTDNPGELTFASGAEFQERPDGLPGVEATYDFEFQNVVQMDVGLTYLALDEGEVEVAMGFATDGRISAFDLVNLEDDRYFFPVYNVAPTLRQSFVDQHPEVVDILNGIAPLLDAETMQRLNYEVDGEHRDVEEVAREWLVAVGLLEE
ncbi:MAG: glycine betaine ABC transporter substrate-binding protein [Dehalococcoidia bacterium]